MSQVRPSTIRNLGRTAAKVMRFHQLNTLDRNVRYALTRLVGKNKLGNYQKTYDDLLSRYNTKTSDFWERHRKRFRKELVCRGIERFKENTYIMEHYSTLNEDNVFWSYHMAYTTAIWQYYHYVKGKDRLSILSNADWEKRDWDRIQAVDHFYNIIDFTRYKSTDRVVICEIGGGYGELGKVLLEKMPNAQYVIVDLPESLLLASYHLRDFVKAKRVRLLLPNEFAQLSRADVFVNIYSFAEMTPTIVKDYLRAFSAKGAKYFYSRNRAVEYNLIDKVSVDLAKLLPKAWKIVRQEPSRTYPGFVDMYVRVA